MHQILLNISIILYKSLKNIITCLMYIRFVIRFVQLAQSLDEVVIFYLD